jgi:hypothetical protein
MAVGHRVRLSTPLGTHEAPMREEALHLQIERDLAGPRVQTDQDRVLVTLTGKDIDLVRRRRPATRRRSVSAGRYTV